VIAERPDLLAPSRDRLAMSCNRSCATSISWMTLGRFSQPIGACREIVGAVHHIAVHDDGARCEFLQNLTKARCAVDGAPANNARRCRPR